MPRIDFPNAISKRGSLPRILSSSKKNSLLSPLNTSFIAGEWEDSRGDPSSRQNPLKQEAEYGEYHNSTSPSTARAIKRSTSLLPLRTRRIFTPPLTGTKPEIETKESEVIDNCQEIRVNKMITVRRGPQVHIPIRKVRCQLTAPAITLETSDSSVPTPNEILIALVDFFAPPTEVKGKLTELEQQATFLDDPHITTAEQMSLDDSMEYLRHSPMNSISCVQHPSVTASTKAVFKHKVDEDDINGSQIPYFSQASGMTGNQSSAGTDLSMKCEPKHPPLTLGGVIGSRRQRSTSQSYNNSQTLDQLNPSLAEALAAMRSKSDITSFGTSQNSSDWFSNRRESLPTRMSGPVKLEAVTPTNSSSAQCANGSTSGHLVSFNGHTTEVPEEIRCHLCDYPMKLCIRKSKYKGEIREYAAYRCLRKGCQTFRSVRKVIDPDFPCPRKRKFEEVFDPGNVSSHVSAKTDDGRTGHSNFVRSNLSSKAEGTLLYIPGRVSYEQVEQMQKFAIGILGKIGGTTVDNSVTNERSD
uniref:Nucleic acid binding protein n=1 Tax=Haemonchus contortus TaxID=6289 RepID=A0A7I4Z1X9_HAECO